MRRFVIGCSLVMLGLAASAQAQSLAAKEAEIRAAVPYSSMSAKMPGMTLRDYNAAVEALAREELGLRQAQPLVPTVPSVPTYEPPSYRQLTPPPTSGSSYDWRSGNSYRWNKSDDGTTAVRGTNLRTGSTWSTTIKPDGSMRGYDSNYNPWIYNSGSGLYMNYGTGEMCTGRGYARVCTGGR